MADPQAIAPRVECPACRGTGLEQLAHYAAIDGDNRCPECGGSGLQPQRLSVPSGTSTTGQGEVKP